jgi:hypothetical protein
MCDVNRIRKEIERFVENEELFTSVDVANAIKRGNDEDMPEWIRNREVAGYLRSDALLVALQIGKNYEATTISVEVNGGFVPATLYYPLGADPLAYSTISEKAITPDEFKIIEASWKGGAPASPQASTVAPSGLAASPSTDDSTASPKTDANPKATTGDAQYTKFRFPTTP